MKRTSVTLENGERRDVQRETTTIENAQKIIDRGFATNFSEVCRLAIAWCALAIDAYDGLNAQRAMLGPRPPATPAGAVAPRSAALRE